MEWKNDSELFGLMRKHLFSAVIGDVLDLCGLHHQFLMPECKPLESYQVLAGRAMTVLERDIDEISLETDVDQTSDSPFGLMLQALDSLNLDEVYVAAGCSPRYALWGELMTIAAQARGAAGAVLAGYTRDTNGILELNFPVFCHGTYAQDQKGRGRVTDYRIPLDIGRVRIEPGDIVFGDRDGVVVIPRDHETTVITKAFEQIHKEHRARQLLLEGATAESVFCETGVL